MGPESKNEDYTLYLDGVPVTCKQILPEITLPDEAFEPPKNTGMCEFIEFTLTIKTPKRWRCRGRKRFIKLMMSEGISRNQAGSVANVARIAGVPYGELWRDYFFFWGVSEWKS